MNKFLTTKKILFVLVLITASFVLQGQSSTHLPYSIFGIGELTSKGFGRNFGMGKTGIALASDQYMNNVNPASHFLIDSISFFFDVGVKGDYVRYRTNTLDQYGANFNMNSLAIGFRINRFWASSLGVAPYSAVGYKVEKEEYVEGNIDRFLVELSGSGGLNQFYWDHSFSFFDRVSVGANITYLFGNIQSVERNLYPAIFTELTYKQSSYYNKLFADFGFQYRHPVNEQITLSLGGIYGNSHRINFEQEVTITNAFGDIVEEELVKSGTFTYPYYYGGGLAVNYDNRLTLTGDYIYQHWEETVSENPYFNFASTRKFRVGIEYMPGGIDATRYFEVMRFRAGFYSEQSYLEVEKNQTRDTGVTLGVSFPFLSNKSTFNLSFQAGRRGSIENGLIEEKYVSVFLNIGLHDWWFLRPQYD